VAVNARLLEYVLQTRFGMSQFATVSANKNQAHVPLYKNGIPRHAAAPANKLHNCVQPTRVGTQQHVDALVKVPSQHVPLCNSWMPIHVPANVETRHNVQQGRLGIPSTVGALSRPRQRDHKPPRNHKQPSSRNQVILRVKYDQRK